MNSRRLNAAKLKRKRAPAASDAIKRLFGGRLFTVKIGKKDKAGTKLTFEQTGGLGYTITKADLKHKNSIDGALKLNMKWRSAAVKAKLQVRTTPPSLPFVLHALTCTLSVCPLATTRTSLSIVASWARSRSRA